MIINPIFDSSVLDSSNFTNYAAEGFASAADEQNAFELAVFYATTELESLFTNNVTLNINIVWGQPSPSTAASSNSPNFVSVDYSTLRNALISNANHSGDPIQLAAVATLPVTDPLGGNYQVTNAEAKALGLPGVQDVDGTITFNSSDLFSFVPNVTPPANEYYFVGVAEHEITEEMGRVASLQTINNDFMPMDLFRYSAPHVRETSAATSFTAPNQAGYFSLTKGVTDYPGIWNNSPNGDLGDWVFNLAPGGADAFATGGTSGVLRYLSTTDVALMDVLGWNPAHPDNDVPNGVTAWVSGNTFPTLKGYSPNNLISTNLNILAGGYLEVAKGGTALGTIINDGGSAQVDHGGVAVDTVVKASGVETVLGTDLATLVEGGPSVGGGNAVQVILPGGTATSASVENKGGVQDDYGTANDTTVHNGGVQDVEPGGKASGTIIDKGGLQDVLGTANNTTVSGEQDVLGSATHTTVDNGGVEVVKDTGSTSGTIVNKDGAQDVFGTATDTTVKSGGVQLVGFLFSQEGSGGGTAIGTVVKSGGIQDDFGTAKNTTVSGEQDVFGSAAHTTVDNGGVQYVEAGGNASGTIIKTGGQEIVDSGGVANGATISGGTLEFKTGATAGSAEITFAGKGGLTLDDSFDFTGLVAGFDKPNEDLDLKDISFVTGKTSETFTQIVPDGGALMVSDGMHTANLNLLGNYITLDFHLASDGHGGTLVTESPFGAPHLPHGFLL